MQGRLAIFITLALAFVLSIFALFTLYRPFLYAILIAFLLFLATQEIFAALERLLKSRLIAAFFMTLGLLGLGFLPLFYILGRLGSIASGIDFESFSGSSIFAFLTQSLEALNSRVQAIFPYLPDGFKLHINDFLARLSSLDWGALSKNAASLALKLSRGGFVFVADTVFILVFLFFFYFYRSFFGAFILSLIPIDKEHTKAICNEVSATISVVFYTSLASMLLQGSLFALLVVFLGYDWLLCGILYGLASLVPVVGGVLVWLPIAGFELYLGNTANAVIIALYSLSVIAFLADNIIKPILIGLINRHVLKVPVKISELLIFFAIFAGITSFGFWGIIIGPAITALFIALLRIYLHILGEQNERIAMP